MRHMARAWAETLDDDVRSDAVAAFAVEALDVFHEERACIAEGLSSLAQPEAELAKCAGVAAAPLPLLEALHWLTGLYSGLLLPETRSRLGAFYTPPTLAARLLDQAEEAGLDWSTARVLDPAAGGSAFLIEAAIRMRAALGECDAAFALAQIGVRLKGFELDRNAARVGQRALEIALGDLAAAAKRSMPTIVEQCDSLARAPRAEFDLVVGNPPYGRVSLSAEQRRQFSRSLYGHANLYGVFTDLALRWAKPNGLVAFLTPTSVLSGQYFSALRSVLASEAPPVAIDFVHARRGVFEDVQQETMLAVYRKGSARQRAQIHYIYVETPTETRIVRNGTVGLPERASEPWLAPRSPEHALLISRAERMPTRLRDLGYRVATGPLVWNRFKKQLRDEAFGNRAHPLVWAEAVGTDGSFRHRAEKKNHSLFFELGSRDDWLLVKDAAVLIQRTTAKEQRRRIIAAELPADFVANHNGVVIENHLNMVVPVGTPKVPPTVLACLFNSEVVDQLFRCISGSVAVSAFELESLPLPPARALLPIEQLLASGASSPEIERAIAALYGQTRP
jgi:adenine-specific DNA-methyltransferase